MTLAESLAALAARRPVAISVTAIAVALVGWLSWQQIPVDLLPDIQSPTIAVSIRAGDRPPTEMERLYGEQLEQRLFTVQGIREITQVARSGKLVATIIFDWDANIEIGLIEVQKALGPIGVDTAVEEIIVRRFDPRQAPVLTYGLIAPNGKLDLADLRQLARRQIGPNLEQLTGVAEVRVTGGREKEIRIQLDSYKLDAFKVTLAQIEQRLQAENLDYNAGTLDQESQIFLVRGLSRLNQASDIAQVVVKYITADDGSQQAIRISDIGSVNLIDQDFDHLVRVNGIEGVGLAIYKEAGANTVEVSNLLHEAMRNLSLDLPNVQLIEINDGAALVKDALKDLFVISAKMISVENIQKTVAEYYNIKLSDLLSKRRSRSITRPRQMAMALTKELTNHSLPEIGEAYNGRDHTTVLHACKKIKELRKESPSHEEDYRYLNRALTN